MMMNHRLIVSSALASALGLGLVTQASGQEKGKEKCYGVAKAGQNDCGNISGSHTCAGQSKDSMSANDWRYVAKGTCKDMKGLSEADAKVAVAGKK